MPRIRMSHALLCAALPVAVAATAALAQQRGDVERGRYLATIMVCADCHSRTAFTGQPLNQDLAFAGAAAGFHVPGLGYFYPPNLTPDPATGLGQWSEDDIVRAIRTGERPDGRILAPIMPYHFFAALSDEDAYSIAAFLKSLPPVVYAEEPPPTGEGQRPPAPYLDLVVP